MTSRPGSAAAPLRTWRLGASPAADRHPEVAAILTGSLREYGVEIDRRSELARRLLGA